jgi:hypothetical protein
LKHKSALTLVLIPWLLGAAPEPAPTTEPDQTPELHRGADYPGEAAFVELGTMTVVYPAGPGEPVEENRRSAEARARWLASVYRNKVEVAADDQTTEEQRKGHLLILGWTNRIFGTGELARPFVHNLEGTSFLGIKESDPDVDLLIFHKNPLNWSSYLVFWSRIDPERDRSQVVPRIGSDWAMYRDYQPIRQGMFVPGRVWPPVRDTIAEADHTSSQLPIPQKRGVSDSARYHISFDRTQLQSQDVKAILDAREAALTKAVAALGSIPEGFRIFLYVYEDEITKRDATGVPDPTHSVPAEHDLYMVTRYARSTSPHEEVHIVARAAYGPCFSTAVYEGLALSVEGTWKGDNMEMHAALLQRSGKLPGPAVLLDEEKFRALPDEMRLPAAGAFMTWLGETYGTGGIRKIYGWNDGRIATFAAALGTNEVQLATAFSSWADAKSLALKSQLDFLAAEKDARAKLVVGDWAGMAAALRRALDAKPGDPQTLFNLASAQMRADNLPGAETTLKKLLASTLKPSEGRFLIFGHYQLGRVYDLAGRRAEALAEYDAVLALPDDHGAHDLARERKITPATKAQLE